MTFFQPPAPRRLRGQLSTFVALYLALLASLASLASAPVAQCREQTTDLMPLTRQLPTGGTVKIVKCYPGGLMRAYCVSFDDGTLGSDWPVLDALRKRHLPATFFINSLHPQSRDAVNFPDQYAGFEIASHGANHKGFIKMSMAEARGEIEQDQKILGDKFKMPIHGFAYPYGAIPSEPALTELERLFVELGLVYARGTASTNDYLPPENFLRWNPDTGLFHDIDKYLNLPATDSVRSLMCFAHSIDFARGKMPFGAWEKQMDRVASEPEIWKVTMIDLARYVTALRALQVKDEGIFNPSSMTVWVYINGAPHEIPAHLQFAFPPTG